MTPLAPSSDAFDVLGLPPRFGLSAEEVRVAWLARSASMHPDRAVSGAGASQDADRVAAALNDARRTLDDPERRAEALLARLGGPAVIGEAERRRIPPAVLMEYMEARETLETAKSTGDVAGVDAMRRWASGKRAGHITAAAALFDRAASLPEDRRGEALSAIRAELNAWRYAERMLEQIDDV